MQHVNISINNCPLNFDRASDVPPPPHHVNRKKCQSKMAPHQPSRKVGPVIKNPLLLFAACGRQKVVFLSSWVVKIADFSILWNKLMVGATSQCEINYHVMLLYSIFCLLLISGGCWKKQW